MVNNFCCLLLSCIFDEINEHLEVSTFKQPLLLLAFFLRVCSSDHAADKGSFFDLWCWQGNASNKAVLLEMRPQW